MRNRTCRCSADVPLQRPAAPLRHETINRSTQKIMLHINCLFWKNRTFIFEKSVTSCLRSVFTVQSADSSSWSLSAPGSVCDQLIELISWSDGSSSDPWALSSTCPVFRLQLSHWTWRNGQSVSTNQRLKRRCCRLTSLPVGGAFVEQIDGPLLTWRRSETDEFS